MQKFTAFISDLDGTLVDSEPQHADAWLQILAGYDLHFDHAWFEQYIGTSDSFLAQDIIKDHAISKTVRELQDEKQITYHEMMRRSGVLFPGVLELVEKIAASYPFAIGTNSGRMDAEVVFDATGLRPFAGISVTADDVKNLKPAPDIFLKAAEALNMDPKNCIVCEDSPAGLTGAKAAGCYVIGISNDPSNGKLSAADEVVADNATALRRVIELLEG